MAVFVPEPGRYQSRVQAPAPHPLSPSPWAPPLMKGFLRTADKEEGWCGQHWWRKGRFEMGTLGKGTETTFPTYRG